MQCFPRVFPSLRDYPKILNAFWWNIGARPKRVRQVAKSDVRAVRVLLVQIKSNKMGGVKKTTKKSKPDKLWKIGFWRAGIRHSQINRCMTQACVQCSRHANKRTGSSKLHLGVYLSSLRRASIWALFWRRYSFLFISDTPVCIAYSRPAGQPCTQCYAVSHRCLKKARTPPTIGTDS